MEKDNLEMLLEDIRGKFDLVLEGHSSLHKRIDKAEQNLDDKISLVDFKVGVLNQKIDGVRDELGQKLTLLPLILPPIAGIRRRIQHFTRSKKATKHDNS